MNVAFKTMKGSDICITAYMPTLERLNAVGGTQKEAKWCILLHFGYKICLVKTLNRRFATSW